jgi:hypothetical protein
MTAAAARRFLTVEAGARPTPVVVARIGRVEVVLGCLVGERCDLELVDALARLQLTATRLGAAIRVRGASPELTGLLELVGMADLLADAA